MIKRKNVIFHVNKQTQHFGSFHENSKIKYIKAYFRDISNISEFNLVYNNEVVLDQDITLKSLSSNKTEILFNIEESKYKFCENISNEKSKNLEFITKDLSDKNEILKEEISKIFFIITYF